VSLLQKERKLEKSFQSENLGKIRKEEKKKKRKWLFLINKLMEDAKESNLKRMRSSIIISHFRKPYQVLSRRRNIQCRNLFQMVRISILLKIKLKIENELKITLANHKLKRKIKEIFKLTRKKTHKQKKRIISVKEKFKQPNIATLAESIKSGCQ